MRTTLVIAAAGLAVLAGGAPAVAHHSFAAEFDGTKPVTLTGTVTKMDWINPHAWLSIDVKGPDGKVVSWMVEGGAPNALLRRGWNKSSVPAGMVVAVTIPLGDVTGGQMRLLADLALAYADGAVRVTSEQDLVVTVQGYRARDGSNRANGRDVTLPDGKKLFIGSPGTGAPGEGR